MAGVYLAMAFAGVLSTSIPASAAKLVVSPKNIQTLMRSRDFIPETRMAFFGLRDPIDRMNVIAYLKTLTP